MLRAICPRAERSAGRTRPPDGKNSEFDSAHTRICQKDLMSIVMLHFRRSQKLIEQLAGQSTNPFGPVRPRGPGRGVSTWPECQGALVLASKSRRTGRHRPRMRRYRGSCNPGQTIPGANNDAIRTCWPSQIHESPVLVRSLLNRPLSVTRTCSARRA